MRTQMAVAARRESVLRTAVVRHHRNRCSQCPEPAFAVVGIRSHERPEATDHDTYEEANDPKAKLRFRAGKRWIRPFLTCEKIE